jgi:hypothetical protein
MQKKYLEFSSASKAEIFVFSHNKFLCEHQLKTKKKEETAVLSKKKQEEERLKKRQK